MRVGIVGCGTAGPAAAIFLARAGHEVEVLERAPACRPVGAGFLLQPSGIEVLEELGIREAVVSRGARVERLQVLNKLGRKVMDLRYGEIGEGMAGCGMHRPILLEALLGVLDEVRVEVRWGVECDGAEKLDRGWRVTSGGEVIGEYDLLVVADGARSRLREQTGIAVRVDEYPWGALWVIGEDREGAFDNGELYQVVNGTGELVGALPTGEGLVSFFWSVRNDEVSAVKAGGPGAWRERFVDLMPEAEAILGRVAGWEEVAEARYYDVRARVWHGDRVVLLGDAGHAMSPQLGQGVNLALVDAKVLAEEVGRAGDLAGALANYSRRRRAVLRYYQAATRWLTPVFQSDYEGLGVMRDAGMPVVQLSGFVRRQMVRTMAGLKRGYLG